MTLSQTLPRTAMTLITAIFATAILFTSSAGQARSVKVAYTAELQAPVESTKLIIKDTVIRCVGTECKGAKSSSSYKTVCAKLSRKVGPLSAFSYKGEPISEEALAKCNG